MPLQALSSNAMSLRAPTLSSLRRVMDHLIIADSDLDAFALDYFPHVKKTFSDGMDRIRKMNLLLERTRGLELISSLRDRFPEEMEDAEEKLQFETSVLLDPSAPVLQKSAHEDAGFGALQTSAGALPLRVLDVRAEVTGLVYRLVLRQMFVNVHAQALEAIYLFPLPPRAAVSRFEMTVGERVIEGRIDERGKARREYNQALAQGKMAASMEEERPGVFTLRVGNLAPGESAAVEITLDGHVPCSDGEAELRFPLVVAPKYMPGAPLEGRSAGEGVAMDTESAPDASRISPPTLLPGHRSPVRLSIEVTIHGAGLSFSPGSLRSSLPATIVDEDEEGRVTVRVDEGKKLDRDFVLRYRVAEGHVGTSLLLCPDEGQRAQGTFVLTVVPQAGAVGDAGPRDVVFLLDRSGSMEGWKMVAARRAIARVIEGLGERDRFQVLTFNLRTEYLFGDGASGLLSATEKERARAGERLAGVQADGGTEMRTPLLAGAQILGNHREAGRQSMLVLVTDGQVGNDAEILREATPRLAETRVFCVGIDSSVNEGFLRQLAAVGRGWCELAESEVAVEQLLSRLHRQIGAPVLTDVQLAAKGFAIVTGQTSPHGTLDVFHGSVLKVMGRYAGRRADAPVSVEVAARTPSGGAARMTIDAEERRAPSVASVWARAHLRDLEDRLSAGRGGAELERQIVQTSLRFGVLCRFTAFVAVEKERVANPGGDVRKIVQAVEAPSDWGASMGQSGPLQVMGQPLGGATFHAPPCSLAPAASAFSAGGGDRSPAPSLYPRPRCGIPGGAPSSTPLPPFGRPSEMHSQPMGPVPRPTPAATRPRRAEAAERMERAVSSEEGLDEDCDFADVVRFEGRIPKGNGPHGEGLGASRRRHAERAAIPTLAPKGVQAQPAFVLPSPTKVRVFCCHARGDEMYSRALDLHIGGVRSWPVIEAWDTGVLSPGEAWGADLCAKMEAADLILLLVSPDMLLPNAEWRPEVMTALRLHQEGKTRVVPLLVHPVDLSAHLFSEISSYPTMGKAVSELTSPEVAWVDLVGRVRLAILKLLADGGKKREALQRQAPP